MRRNAVAAVLCALVLGGVVAFPTSSSFAQETRAATKRVVVFAMPGVNWQQIDAADVPTIDGLLRTSAVAALVVRTATRGMAPVRGYATLGAGQRAYARVDDVAGHRAFEVDAELENDTAKDVAARRYGRTRPGSIVATDLALLTRRFIGPDYGAKLGALGEAVHDAGLRTAVVAAGDREPNPDEDTVRRAAAISIADRSGMIDAGTVSGLLRPDAEAPFGVRTDPEAFADAFADALDADVIVVDPGETQRADEFSVQVSETRAEAARLAALERTDDLLDRVVRRIGDDDLLMVLAPSGPRTSKLDQLTPVIVRGPGFDRGWLTSPLTRRDGLVLLTDVAATALASLGIDIPSWISDSTMTASSAEPADAVGRFVDMDEESSFRELFVTIATVMLIALLVALAIATLMVFLRRSGTAKRYTHVLALAVLALPVAALGVRISNGWRLGATGATLLLAGFVVVLCAIAAIGRLRAHGGLVLVLLGLLLATLDLLLGSPWQLNGAFGYSPLQAGRFYGNGNLGFAVFVTCGIVGLTALADAFAGAERRRSADDKLGRAATWWLGAALVAIVLMEGLPQLGADFGGVLAGVPALFVVWLVARDVRVKPRMVVGVAAAAAVAGGTLMVLDMLRPPARRTHLGSLAARIADEGFEPLVTIVRRKGEANIHLLIGTRWTWVVPLTAALLALLFWRGRGLLGGTLARRPLLRAGLFGSLTAGIVGMLVNDSGIAIPAMTLILTVPFFVLVGLDELDAERSGVPPGASR
jgi:hypothetical protein